MQQIKCYTDQYLTSIIPGLKRLRRKDGKYCSCIDAANPWFGVDGQFKRRLVEINYALPETLVETLQCNVKTIHFYSYV
jgi:hypothetical protein